MNAFVRVSNARIRTPDHFWIQLHLGYQFQMLRTIITRNLVTDNIRITLLTTVVKSDVLVLHEHVINIDSSSWTSLYQSWNESWEDEFRPVMGWVAGPCQGRKVKHWSLARQMLYVILSALGVFSYFLQDHQGISTKVARRRCINTHSDTIQILAYEEPVKLLFLHDVGHLAIIVVKSSTTVFDWYLN